MQIKFFFLVACLLAASLLGANNSSSCVNLLTPKINDKALSCDVPAPLNFKVLETGPSSVKFIWEVSAPSFAYRIRVYRSSDSLLLSTTVTVPGAAFSSIAITGNVSCYAKINTICEDGSQSPYNAESAPFIGYILDLVIQGYTPSSSPVSCRIDANFEFCPYLTDSTANFRVQLKSNPTIGRGFSMTKNSGGNYVLHTGFPNDGNQIFWLKADGFNPDTVGREKYQITLSNGLPIAVFQAYFVTNIDSKLQCSSIRLNYEIVQLKDENRPINSPQGQIRERTDQIISFLSQPATVYPNPFSNNLDVYLSQNTTEQVQLQLYNLAGQKVLDQQFTGGQAQYSLSTASLSPGFYLLRIEADGEVQTLKVVKSE